VFRQASDHIRKLFSRLLIRLIVLVTVSIVLSGVIIYLLASSPLEPSYRETISSIDVYKTGLLKNSIFIYALFTVLMTVGVIIFSLLYSHRIAGPLCRMKAVAGDIAGGDKEASFDIRRNDAVHTLADIINAIDRKYGAKHASLGEELEELHKGIGELEKSVTACDAEAIKENIRALKSVSDSIDKKMSRLKL
jgi:methyl-accepting chemotaxis protein